tara:strand:- start:503 stop:799 length:297 start_codon:yes stop_codon:yes gene_type:complete
MRSRRPLSSKDQVSKAKISPLSFTGEIRNWTPSRKSPREILTEDSYKAYKPTRTSGKESVRSKAEGKKGAVPIPTKLSTKFWKREKSRDVVSTSTKKY